MRGVARCGAAWCPAAPSHSPNPTSQPEGNASPPLAARSPSHQHWHAGSKRPTARPRPSRPFATRVHANHPARAVRNSAKNFTTDACFLSKSHLMHRKKKVFVHLIFETEPTNFNLIVNISDEKDEILKKILQEKKKMIK